MENHEIPSWWNVANLSDVASKLVDGSHNPPSKQGAGLPMLSAVNINDNKILFSDYRLISEEAFLLEDRRTRITVGDVLLTIVGAIGRAAVVPESIPKFTLQRSVAVITPLHIVSKFLMYQFESPRITLHFKKNARGTAQKGVYLKTLGNTEIWLPSVNEQHRIVAKIEELFSELDKGIENLKTARAQLKVYRQALLKHSFEGKLTAQWRAENHGKLETAEALLKRIQQERAERYQQQLADWEASGKQGSKPKTPKLLPPLTAEELAELPELPEGWGWCKLGDFIVSIDAGKSFKCDEREPLANEIGVAKVSAVTWGEYDESESKTCTDTSKENEAYLIRSGDFILSRANTIDLVGACVIARKVTKKIMLSDKTLRIKFDGFSPEYFLQYLGSRIGRKQIMRLSTGNQESMRNIGQDRIRSIAVPICSGVEAEVVMEALASKLSEVDQLDQTIATSLQQAEALRQSILKKAFSGRLVPQDPNDEPAGVLLERIQAEKVQLGKLASSSRGKKNSN
ncbi:MAG: restriction endonuclease subunit S [Methylobacter sp.]